MRRRWRWMAIAAACLTVPPAVYLASALVLSRIPVNQDFRPPAEGVLIGVVDNGVHADLILPVRSLGIDWRESFPPDAFPLLDMAGSPPAAVTVGWGHREFYLNTPSWAELRPATAARALLGLGGAVVHVAYWPPLGRAESTAWVLVSDEGYRRLAAYVRAALRPGTDGRPAWIAGARYRENDAFFEAKGAYGPILTCNEWTGRALAAAGVRTGFWTPFSGALLDHLGDL